VNESPVPYHLTADAIPPLLDYCREKGLTRFFLVADKNTYSVLGQRVEAALLAQGWDVKTILLTGAEIVTNENSIVQVQVETSGESRTFLAVGSGTITDITRFVSHRSHDPFLSIPTAPSVDGFTSTVAPTVVGSYKAPIPAQPPAAVFADLPTLCAAPRAMIAAGLGDLLGKYTSLADWRIGHLLYDEPYDPLIEQQMRASVDNTIEALDSIADGTETGISRLMDGLVGSGFGMLAFGDSRPASGSEHHIGHFWEMKLIVEGRPAALHGAEVGVATILSARRFALLRQMTRGQAEEVLLQRTLPDPNTLIDEITAGYGPAAARIIAVQQPLLTMTPGELQALKDRILDQWDAVQEIAAAVPFPEQFASWLETVGGVTVPSQLNLSDNETVMGLRCAHYLRDRFTLNRLAFWLDLPLGFHDSTSI
jgi:glycerol-1-phosphate dehydrogenase [NAD(P)+]